MTTSQIGISTCLLYATDIWISVEPKNLIALKFPSLAEAVDVAMQLTKTGRIVWRIADTNGKLLMDRDAIEKEYAHRTGHFPDPNRSVDTEEY